MRKNSLVLFCVLGLLFLLSGCSGGSTGGEKRLTLKILEINENNVTAEALESEDIHMDSLPRYSFGISELDDIGAQAGDIVNVIYTGDVMETWPMQIQAVSWGIEEKASGTEASETVEAGVEDEPAGDLLEEGTSMALEILPERKSECSSIIFGGSNLLRPGGGVFDMSYTKGHEHETWYYDEFYTLSRYENGEWKELPRLVGMCGTTSYHEVYKDTPDIQEFDWVTLYGELEPGIYSLSKEVFPKKLLADEPDLEKGALVHAVFQLKDRLGISLLVWGEKPTGLTMSFGLYDEESERELFYESWYRVDRLENGMWVPADYVLPEEQVAWTEEAYTIPDTRNVDVDWEWLYGELKPGRYRFCKKVMDFRGTGDYDTYEYTAEFEIP